MQISQAMFSLAELCLQLSLQLPAPFLELLQLLLGVMAAGWYKHTQRGETETIIVNYQLPCSLSTIQLCGADWLNDHGSEL